MTNGNILKGNQKAEQEAKEKRREIALKNLRAESLPNLATAFFTQREDSGYGKADNDSVEEFLYEPSLRKADYYNLKTGRESSIVYESLLGSREEGRRYSGQVSESGIIKTAAIITQDSLGAIKVEDLMGLLGSELNIKKDYQNRYISDLLASENKEEKELAQKLVGGYMQYLTTKGVSKALGLRATAIRGGLEKIVGEEEKE